MLGVALSVAAAAVAAPPAAEWVGWIDSLGHDNYSYPWWITEQIKACDCAPAASVTAAAACVESGVAVDWRASIAASRAASGAGELTFCLAKAWLIDHMPTFDKHYLPGSVTVNATSMLDDNIAFTLMADRAAPWSGTVSLEHKLTYTLPYASYHESRQNWRPLFFAKFFSVVADAATAEEALERLIDPNVFLNWTGHYWPSSPQQPRGGDGYQIKWSSSTSPPIVAPLDFVAYGYASCSGWATLVSCVFVMSFRSQLEEEGRRWEEAETERERSAGGVRSADALTTHLSLSSFTTLSFIIFPQWSIEWTVPFYFVLSPHKKNSAPPRPQVYRARGWYPRAPGRNAVLEL